MTKFIILFDKNFQHFQWRWVYTIYQFKEQLSFLLQQMEHFIEDSSTHINEIILANTEAYHQAIRDQQNLSFLKKWLTSEQEKLSTFIQNQDTLAQFPSTTIDLTKVNHDLKEHVSHILVHLNTPKLEFTDFDTIAGKAQELNLLMSSMYQWIDAQHELKGLEPPQKRQQLKWVTTQKPAPQPQKSKISFFQEEPVKNSFKNEHFIPFVYEKPLSDTFIQPLAITSGPGTQFHEKIRVRSEESGYSLYLSLALLFPVLLLTLYFMSGPQPESEVSEEALGTAEEYEAIQTQVDDLFVVIQNSQMSTDPEVTEDYEDFMDTYKKLEKEAQSGRYKVQSLITFLKDLEYFYKECCHKTQSIRL